MKGLRNARTTNLHYRIQNYFLPGEEEFFITVERLKCCQSDRPVNWFVWDWVKSWLKRMFVGWTLVTNKLRGEHMQLPKRNWHAFPRGSKNCPLACCCCHVISSLFPSTTAFTNISVSNWCSFDPPEFLLHIHSTSGNQWGFWTGASSCFLWKEFCLQMPKCLKSLKPVRCNWTQWRTCIKIVLLQLKFLLSTCSLKPSAYHVKTMPQLKLQWKMKKVAERFISKLQEKLKLECVSINFLIHFSSFLIRNN